MNFTQLALGCISVYLLIIPFIGTTPSITSAIIYKVVPFFLGVMSLIAFLISLGFSFVQ